MRSLLPVNVALRSSSINPCGNCQSFSALKADTPPADRFRSRSFPRTIELIKQQGGEGTKVINLVKSIEKTAEENSDDPYLIAMAERVRFKRASRTVKPARLKL